MLIAIKDDTHFSFFVFFILLPAERRHLTSLFFALQSSRLIKSHMHLV